MTNYDIIVEFLRSIYPNRASNSMISARTGVRPHQQVFQITSRLEKEKRVTVRWVGAEKEFCWAPPSGNEEGIFRRSQLGISPKVETTPKSTHIDAYGFEEISRRIFENLYSRPLPERLIKKVSKKFDFVSDDESIVGDAKYYSMVNNEQYPPAKMSTISEYIWLLENTDAHTVFLVFGNDQRVPDKWLEKYGHLVKRVKFYFINNKGEIIVLR